MTHKEGSRSESEGIAQLATNTGSGGHSIGEDVYIVMLAELLERVMCFESLFSPKVRTNAISEPNLPVLNDWIMSFSSFVRKNLAGVEVIEYPVPLFVHNTFIEDGPKDSSF